MPSKITNLLRMQGVGIFSDRTVKSANPEFRQFNLIYGFNGCGKSTLSRLFASLQTGALHPRLPDGCSFDFMLDDGKTVGCTAGLTGLEKRVLVFNSDFIEKNLQWTDSKINPVFYIGKDQTEAAAKLEKREAELPALGEKEKAAEKAQKQAEKTLADFKRDQAQITAARLHLENQRYDARNLKKDYETWASGDIRILDDDALKATEEVCRRAEPMPAVDLIAFDTGHTRDPNGDGSIEKTLQKTFECVRNLCGKTFSTIALDEMQKYPEMLLWIKQGYAFHEEQHLEKCLLCGNAFSQQRRDRISAALDEQINQFIDKLSKTSGRLTAIIGEVAAMERKLPQDDAISADLRASFKKEKADLLTSGKHLKTHLDQLNDALNRKIARPASPADVSGLISPTAVDEVARQYARAIENINKVIDQHNSIVANFKKHRDDARLAIRQHFIASCRQEFKRHIKTCEQAGEEAKLAQTKRAEAQQDIEALLNRIRTHGPAAETINRLTESCLGHKELTIRAVGQEKQAGYEILRHGQPIDGSPSEGEKTAIAIAYFLSTMESEGRKLKDLIVVVDDPVSSLDTKALNYACSLIKSKLSGACQLFVFTHNQQCLNEFRKAWKGKTLAALKKAKSDKEPKAALLFIDVTMPDGNGRRTSSIIEMPRLLREYDSEYHFLFSHLLRFTDKGDAYSEYGYMMPDVLRRVFEVFAAFKFPGSSSLAGKIDQIHKKYPDLDQNRLKALERLCQIESHSDNLDDLIAFSSMTLEETQQAASSLLALIQHVDKEHFSGMKDNCSEKQAGPA